MPRLRVHRQHPDAKLPEYAHFDDAGFDLYSIEDVVINSIHEDLSEAIASVFIDGYEGGNYNKILSKIGEYIQVPYALVRTGITVELPEGYELQIRSKSGLAAKSGIFVLNSPATIDEGYRGELLVCLCNLSAKAYSIKKGQKIAQGVIAPYIQAEIIDMGSGRGTGGFGSTGSGLKDTPLTTVEQGVDFKVDLNHTQKFSREQIEEFLNSLASEEVIDSNKYVKDVVINSLPITSEQSIEELQRQALMINQESTVVDTSIDETQQTKPYPQDKFNLLPDLGTKSGITVTNID